MPNEDELSHHLYKLEQLLNEETCHYCKLIQYKEIPSAQQRVIIVTVELSHQNHHNHPPEDHNQSYHRHHISPSTLGKRILDELTRSQGRLVLRIWKGGARWWNLTSNAKQECIKLAHSEVAGYKLARFTFEWYHQYCRNSCDGGSRICIPQVLYFDDSSQETYRTKQTSTNETDNHDWEVGGASASPLSDTTCHYHPWAILSHVKDLSILVANDIDINEQHDLDDGMEKYVFCDEFVTDMVKVRREFGFDEPHPRHGRVCIENALEYAMNVLNCVVIPMHTVFFSFDAAAASGDGGGGENDNYGEWMQTFRDEIQTLNMYNIYGSGKGVTYEDMVHLYHDRMDKIQQSLKEYQRNKVHHNNTDDDDDDDDDKMDVLVNILSEFLPRLFLEAKTVQAFSLPFALCHLDLQPQNMILYKSATTMSRVTDSNVPRIAAILDWEESCYADPRFELLLLCRKVVANRQQADELWEHYSNFVRSRFGMDVGPMDPWLRLESVHSLLTMCMQGLNLLEGGRSPWEGNSDLRGKIDREMYRLYHNLG